MTGARRRASHRRAAARCAVLLGALLCLAPPTAHAATPANVTEADRLAASPDLPRRVSELSRWAKKASLAEIMFVLRHEPRVLGAAEAPLVRAALARTSDARADLRRRLRVRLALADRGQAKKMLGQSAGDAAAFGARVRASAYQVAVLLPATGPYAAYSRSLREGIRAGFALHNTRTALPIEVEFWPTGDDDPARAAAVLDSASRRSAVVIGELLSVPTLALGAGARMVNLPLLSPTATDEKIGAAGESVFQVGPSNYQRGQALAEQALRAGRRRAAILVSSDQEGRGLARGFAEALEDAGVELAWRDIYAPGNMDFRSEVKRLEIEDVDVLFWDGDAREAGSLLRELQRQGVRLHVVGGDALAPENHHTIGRPLLDGVHYVGSEYVLDQALQAPLDSLLGAAGAAETNSFHVRGFLAAHLLARVVEGRALCPEEIGASLLTRVTGDPYVRRRGFLDWGAEGAALPVYEVTKGEAVRIR